MTAKESKACVNHPERVGRWRCAKFSVVYCDECCRCPHPEGYCAFRRQCPIQQICLEGGGEPETGADGGRRREGCRSG